jgi:hypothetical protein
MGCVILEIFMDHFWYQSVRYFVISYSSSPLFPYRIKNEWWTHFDLGIMVFQEEIENPEKPLIPIVSISSTLNPIQSQNPYLIIGERMERLTCGRFVLSPSYIGEGSSSLGG